MIPIESVVNLLLPLLVAMLTVVVAHPTLVKIARRKHLVDNPNARKLNKEPMPVLGGVGVTFGLMVAVGVACYVMPDFYLPAEVVIAIVVLLYTGVADDILDLTPRRKLLLQAFVVLMLIFSAELYIDNLYGLWGLYYLPWWLTVALTLAAGVGIINAMNLIDGVDGLCALYAIFASMMFGISFALAADYSYAVLAFATVGALIPFVLHNIYGAKYKMFLGDGGSLVLGFLCAVFVLRVLQSEHSAIGGSSVVFAFAVMAVPVCDTLRVMSVRMARRRSPFSPDKSHLHHQFIALGMSHRLTAFAIVGLDVVIVGVWLSSVMAGASAEWQVVTTLFMAVMLTWGVYYLSGSVICRPRWMVGFRRVARLGLMRRTQFVERLQRVLNDKT